jgi:hypothetical protein
MTGRHHHRGLRRFDAERVARVLALLARAAAELIRALHVR